MHQSVQVRLTNYDNQRTHDGTEKKGSNRRESVYQISSFTFFVLVIERVASLGEERGRTVISACLFSYVPGWSAPTACDHSQGAGTSQQAHACSRWSLHWTSLCTVMNCPDTACFSSPLGAKVSDVQFGRHVDLCHSPSTSAGNAQGCWSTSSVLTRGHPG